MWFYIYLCRGVTVGVGDWLGHPGHYSPRDSKVLILNEKFLFSALSKF